MLYMPKPDKNDALNDLILGHEVLQKCSNFFQSDLGLNSKLSWKKVRSPHITRQFLGIPGLQNSSLREVQPVYYFSMVLNEELGTSDGRNNSLCSQDGVGTCAPTGI